jgi:hypothetical protein
MQNSELAMVHGSNEITVSIKAFFSCELMYIGLNSKMSLLNLLLIWMN